MQCGCCDFGVDQGYLPFRPIATPQLLSPSFRCSRFPLHPHFRVITLSESVLLGRRRFWGFLPYLCEYWSVGLSFLLFTASHLICLYPDRYPSP